MKTGFTFLLLLAFFVSVSAQIPDFQLPFSPCDFVPTKEVKREQPNPYLYHRTRIKYSGIDFKLLKDSRVFAAADGIVVVVDHHPIFHSAVIINHGKYFSVYSNLSDPDVSPGDTVAAGQELATVYFDEETKKCELHFEIWEGREKLKPMDYLPEIYPSKRIDLQLPVERTAVDTTDRKLWIYYPHGLQKQSRRLSNSVELWTDKNTAVFAAASGVIDTVIINDRRYGNHIIISHVDGWSTKYAYLDRCTVESGAKVEKGQLIGCSGNSRASIAPNLRFEVYNENCARNHIRIQEMLPVLK